MTIMASALSTNLFADTPTAHFPQIAPFPKVLAVPKLFALLTILVLGAVFWYSIAWLGTQVTFQFAGYDAVFIEGIDPVLPEYYSGFGR